MIPILYNFGLVDLEDFDIEDFDTVSVAKALARIKRFAGNFDSMSVAQHAILVSTIVKELGGSASEQLAALHHDDAEVFTGDITANVKKLCPEIQRIEDSILDVVDETYQIRTRAPIVVKADKIAGFRELHFHMDMTPLMARYNVIAPPDAMRFSIRASMLTPWPEATVVARFMDMNDSLCEELVGMDPEPLQLEEGEDESCLN